MSTPISRIILAASLSLALVFTGCSKDDGEKETSSTAGDYSELCDLAREALTIPTSKQLENAEAQLAAAPEDLKADYQVVVDAIKYRTDNPSDASGIASRQEEALAALARIAPVVEEKCGFDPLPLGG